ncbi:MAG TPA: 50S ribosomal protein L23 [Bacteroidales bacterium]|nr:50S ribosomal protein L23 [Bacteroidales bacterium]
MDILIKPIVTEKMTKIGEKQNMYAFKVKKNANKLQIKKAVEDMYGVSVESVNTLIVGGKNKSRYTKTGFIQGRSSSYKKAIITVANNDKIDFFSNI